MNTSSPIQKPYYRQPIPCYGFESIYAETKPLQITYQPYKR